VYAQFDNVANVWRCTKCGRADHEPTAAVEDARTGIRLVVLEEVEKELMSQFWEHNIWLDADDIRKTFTRPGNRVSGVGDDVMVVRRVDPAGLRLVSREWAGDRLHDWFVRSFLWTSPRRFLRWCWWRETALCLWRQARYFAHSRRSRRKR
jgi:hypothetical protein